MGDIIEMTTWPGQSNVFYRVTSSGLMFEVKTTGSAAIGLAKKPGNTCDIWVVIGERDIGKTWIKKKDKVANTALTPNILNTEDYKRFWLTWRNDCVQLGQENERIPVVLSHACNVNWDVCYVTFSSFNSEIGFPMPVYWRIELSPSRLLEKRILKSITNGKLVWLHTDDQSLPKGAIIGGFEMENLYIMRAYEGLSLVPGKLVSSNRTGYVAWSGETHAKNEFEVLCGFDCTWVPSYGHEIPIGAVEGGFAEESMEKLFIGRGSHLGNLIPGTIRPSHRVCYIPYENKEIALDEYEILVSPENNPRCVNSSFIEHIHIESIPETAYETVPRRCLRCNNREPICFCDRELYFCRNNRHGENIYPGIGDVVYLGNALENMQLNDDLEYFHRDDFDDIHPNDDFEGMRQDAARVQEGGHKNNYLNNGHEDSYPNSGHEDIHSDDDHDDIFPVNGHQDIYTDGNIEDIDPNDGLEGSNPDDSHEDINSDDDHDDIFPVDDHEDIRAIDDHDSVDGHENIYPVDDHEDIQPVYDHDDIYADEGHQEIYLDGNIENIDSNDGHEDSCPDNGHEDIHSDYDHDNIFSVDGHEHIFPVDEYIYPVDDHEDIQPVYDHDDIYADEGHQDIYPDGDIEDIDPYDGHGDIEYDL